MTEAYATLKENLLGLSLKTICALFETEAQKATKAKLAYTDYLGNLAAEEISQRTDRSIQAKINKARFPQIKPIEMLDFKFQAAIDEQQVKELTHLAFIDKAENIVWLGPPGVGKTHLAISRGILACTANKRVQFISATALMDELLVAHSTKTLAEKLAYYCRLDLILIDELGYMPFSKEGANLFFQLISRRYEQGSVIITTNKSFSEWGDIFAGDNTLAAAIIDRVLHHAHIFQITGKSYRVKNRFKK